MLKPTLQFRKLTELEFARYAENILVRMTENAELFPEPEPSLALLESTLTSFNRSAVDASYRDVRLVVIKNQQLARLKAVVMDLSLYVTRIARGDQSLILAAGFTPSKGSTAYGIAPKPTDLRAMPIASRSGEVNLRVRAWLPAAMYFFEYRKAQTTDAWVRVSTTRSFTLIQGLESLQSYEFRVAYAATDPTLTYSDVVLAVVM